MTIVSEPQSGNSSVSELHTCKINVSELHIGNSSVSEPHIRSITVSEPHTNRVTVSKPHTRNSNVSESHPHVSIVLHFTLEKLLLHTGTMMCQPVSVLPSYSTQNVKRLYHVCVSTQVQSACAQLEKKHAKKSWLQTKRAEEKGVT